MHPGSADDLNRPDRPAPCMNSVIPYRNPCGFRRWPSATCGSLWLHVGRVCVWYVRVHTGTAIVTVSTSKTAPATTTTKAIESVFSQVTLEIKPQVGPNRVVSYRRSSKVTSQVKLETELYDCGDAPSDEHVTWKRTVALEKTSKDYVSSSVV